MSRLACDEQDQTMQEGNAVQQFVANHAEHVIGTLSGFDRLVFRGTMRALCNRSGLMSYLWAVQVRLTEFAAHVQKLIDQLKDASVSLARPRPSTSSKA